MAAPPNDTFNDNGNTWMNIEGPVWIGDALYISEMKGSPNPPQTRIIKVTGSDEVSVAVMPDSGSNGMAVDGNGNLVTANHGVGGIVSFALPGFTKTTLTAAYPAGGMRFNSPNDLAIRSDGTIYFSDPTFQANSPTQAQPRFYRLPPGAATAQILVDNANNPNGVTLSLDEKTLFLADGNGVTRYAVNTDGTIVTPGKAVDPTDLDHNAVDGMAMDCAGNLYAVRVNQHDIIVVGSLDAAGSAGTKIGQISISGAGNFTNVAFGGSDHQTLYITAQGNGTARGVYKLKMPLPGMPY